MTKHRISYQEAEALLLPDAATDLPKVATNELRAVVTHWLQNPHSAPIFGDEKLRDKWISKLAAHAAGKKAGASGKAVKKPAADIEITCDVAYPPPKKEAFTFIDLFAGIGGFRQALQAQQGKCIFSCEWDPNAQKTYHANYAYGSSLGSILLMLNLIN